MNRLSNASLLSVPFLSFRYFRQSKLTSFQRQLNLYGFQRLTRGADAGGYYHELFLRNRVFLAKRMERTKVKGTKFKAASSPESEPNFSTMSAVTPLVSSDEEGSSGSVTADSFASRPPVMAFEPLPVQFSSAPIGMAVMQQQPVYAFPEAPVSIPVAVAAPVPQQQRAPPASADQVLDDAVDELFLTEDDTLADFCFDWDPTGSGLPLEDDTQLGFMLEKLLED